MSRAPGTPGLFDPRAEPPKPAAEPTIAQRAARAFEAFALNRQQADAAEHTGSPLVVLAGPGTGKTRVLTARILRLLRDGAEPESILALTFTIKAAREMRHRLAESLGDHAQRVNLLTFHALAWRLINRFSDVLALPARIRLRDSAESRRIIRAICRQRRLFAFRSAEGAGALATPVASFIAACRSAARTPADAMAAAQRWLDETDPARAHAAGAGADPDAASRRLMALQFADAAQAYSDFERLTREQGLIGYDDALVLADELLRHERFVAPIIRAEVRHLLVDEFQDVNPAQINILRGLAPPPDAPGAHPPDVMVVGDDDQAIYAFRGANSAAFDQFVAIYEPRTRVTRLRLEANYRSRPAILRAAQAVIERSDSRFDPDKRLQPNPTPDPSAADPQGIVECVTIRGVVDQFGPLLAALIQRDRERSGAPFDRYAIITRLNGSADRIATVLRLAGIPVDRRHARTPTDNPAIQDLLAWIRLLLNPGDIGSAQRILLRPPVLTPPDLVARWLGTHARAALLDDPGAVSPDAASAAPARDPASGFMRWLRAAEPDLPAPARLAADTAERLAPLVRTRTADLALQAIIHETGLLHAAADRGERAELIADLAAVLRFARARLAHLEPPGDLAAFWSYYNDLDESDRDFAEPAPDDPEDPDTPAAHPDPPAGPADPLPPDASGPGVAVITAHSAKGLEFDTVFVVDVRPPYGFPKTMTHPDERFPAPDGFFPPPAPTLEEERRIFYVACTRAQRRLVFIAKARSKQASTSTDYLLELAAADPPLDITSIDGTDLLPAAADDDPNPDAAGTPTSPREAMAERIRLAARRERHRAFAALHEAEDAAEDPARLAAITDRLAEHARTLAAIRRIERGSLTAADATAQLDERTRHTLRGLLHDAQQHLRRASASPFRPMRPPLTLSYSAVDAYTRCPRCFWIEKVLGLRAQSTPELALGSAVHEALEAHFKAVRLADAGEGPHPDPSRTIHGVRARVLEKLPPHTIPEPELIERAQSMVAAAIGTLHQPGDLILDIERSFSLPYHTADNPAVAHRIVGRIDRIDQRADGTIRIIDYKTGTPSAPLRKPVPADKQMGIYALALAALYGDQPRAIGEYWLLRTGQRGTLSLSAAKPEPLRKWLDSAIAGMLAGDFPRGEDCQRLCAILDPDAEPGSVSPMTHTTIESEADAPSEHDPHDF